MSRPVLERALGGRALGFFLLCGLCFFSGYLLGYPLIDILDSIPRAPTRALVVELGFIVIDGESGVEFPWGAHERPPWG